MTKEARSIPAKEKTLMTRVESLASNYEMSVTQLASLSETELMKIPNLGKRAIMFLKTRVRVNPLEFWL